MLLLDFLLGYEGGFFRLYDARAAFRSGWSGEKRGVSLEGEEGGERGEGERRGARVVYFLEVAGLADFFMAPWAIVGLDMKRGRESVWTVAFGSGARLEVGLVVAIDGG